MTDNLDQYGRPLGGQLERDARLLAAAAGVDLTAGHADNANREYWCDRAREAHEQLRRFGRDADVVDFVTKAQNVQLVSAQMNYVGAQVDAALGHRYHKPGVHYSVPHIAQLAAAELKELESRRDAALALTEPDPLRHWDTQWPIRAALEGMTAAEYAGEAGTDVALPLTGAQRSEVDELARRMLADDLANLAEPPEADHG